MIEAPARTRAACYRPRQPGEYATLGMGILGWAFKHIPSPADETQPFILTPEQCRYVLRLYEVDPKTGERLHRRCHLEEPKGWGKSPFAAFIALAEFAGPVCFDHWDPEGQPKGARWGTGGRQPPWVQVAACSEDQTENTYRALYEFLTADGRRAARELRIDEGRTRLYLKDQPGAFLERVTASAGSREGQRLTFAVLDEPQLWNESNGGHRLARTILRNLAKSNGWALFTGNAPVLGEGSVAESMSAATPGVLHLSHRPATEPVQGDLPAIRGALEEVYAGAWWINIDRIMAEIADPAQPWKDSLRFFLNIRVRDALQTWLPQGAWVACTGAPALDTALPIGVGVYRSHTNGTAAVACCQRQGARYAVVCREFQPQEATGHASSADIRAHLLELAATYPAPGMRDPETRWPVRGPAVAFDRMQFDESAEALDLHGVNMVDFPMGAAHMGPVTQAAYEAVTAGALLHDGDPDLAAQADATTTRSTERGLVVVPTRKHGTTSNHAIVALLMALAMVVADTPLPPRPARASRTAGF